MVRVLTGLFHAEPGEPCNAFLRHDRVRGQHPDQALLQTGHPGGGARLASRIWACLLLLGHLQFLQHQADGALLGVVARARLVQLRQ